MRITNAAGISSAQLLAQLLEIILSARASAVGRRIIFGDGGGGGGGIWGGVSLLFIQEEGKKDRRKEGQKDRSEEGLCGARWVVCVGSVCVDSDNAAALH
jgi:hypothetical protein